MIPCGDHPSSNYNFYFFLHLIFLSSLPPSSILPPPPSPPSLSFSLGVDSLSISHTS
ncbi:uncharacterized protein BO72DRAFT_9737 [Aspergillus fijiensis CBS 313.89]|uniref:Uncharacterized protein n=1 Tax=Aspergillus fijiensis CBS 313.89 TaxID=1448319 RepID=A0A8G1S135_9EURO|nr:uncharacterized protein BO72DRAFT_9737 [Aspergillus fijiensis CBS 313.89]RAK82768.1 hypothetical protein BO72DRAFT_9737 [Aspergillus fijiensis CBS 313.89]